MGGLAASIDVEDVRRSFGSRVVLDGVTLHVPAGRFVALMGPSGSGKSTLLHLIAGLARPDGGRVRVDGLVVHDLSETAAATLRRDRIGFVFQAFNLVPVLSARENVALPLRIAGASAAAARERADELLAQLDLAAVRDDRPATLSGGEQQRVAIARAMAAAPGAVLADEPTGSLDAKTGAAVLLALRHLQQLAGTTVLMVTHDPRAAAAADEVVRFEDGHVVDHLVLDGWSPPGGRDGLIEPEERSQLVLSWLRGSVPRRTRRRRADVAAIAAS